MKIHCNLSNGTNFRIIWLQIIVNNHILISGLTEPSECMVLVQDCATTPAYQPYDRTHVD